MKIDKEQAEEAVRILLKWIGEDLDRPNLSNTPARVVRNLAERFQIIDKQDAVSVLLTSLIDLESANTERGMIIFPNIHFTFYCEHSLALTIGTAHVAYLPRQYIVGLGSMQRLVKFLGRKLQLQEQFTQEIGQAIDCALQPLGSAVAVKAKHYCADGAELCTHYYSGVLENNTAQRQEFLVSMNHSFV